MDKQFEPKMCWDSDMDNILDDFYLEGLKNSKMYDRLAGYFSSTLFVRTAYETLDFIKQGGIVRIVTSTALSQNDLETIQNLDQSLATASKSWLDEMLQNTNDIHCKCKSLFGWLLKQRIEGKRQVEIKVAIPKNSTGVFHQKVGIFTLNDGGIVSFSGSVNETIMGWEKNSEQFKVFRNWGDITNVNAVKNDQDNFERYWNNQMREYLVVDLPSAVIDHLLSVAPDSEMEFSSLLSYLQRKFYKKQHASSGIVLRKYQESAIKLWEENNFQGIFAMATGTGKTYTALGGINKVLEKRKRVIVIITSPQKHIADQWKNNIRFWNDVVNRECVLPERIVMANSENPNWKNEINDIEYKFNKKVIGQNRFLLNECVVCTTHSTFAKDEFVDKIVSMKKNGADVLLIVDEVHGVGSPKRQKGLSPLYEYRLGLSATPIRHYDELGTKKIQEYFKKTVYELPLQTAIADGHLVQYSYHPHYVELTDDELAEYRDLTIKLAKKYMAKARDQKIDDGDTRLEERRANIIATATNKYFQFEKILDAYGSRLAHCLVYCHPHQIEDATRILTARNIINEKITWEDPTHDRERIINALENEQYQCVTAMRCLDEGYDIPSAKIAIILASSGDPRQYIQRRGRVLRRSQCKDHAEIHDILVKPSQINVQDLNVAKYVKKLVARELLRHKEFASAAFNKKEAYDLVSHTALNYGIILEDLSPSYIDSL